MAARRVASARFRHLLYRRKIHGAYWAFAPTPSETYAPTTAPTPDAADLSVTTKAPPHHYRQHRTD